MGGNKIAVVMVRGLVDTNMRIRDTMRMMGLTRVNHCVLVGEGQKGMVQKCKDYVTWGEIDEETLEMLVSKRGLKPGNKKLSPADFENAGFKDPRDFASKVINSGTKLSSLGIKKVFRLHPPRKGHSQIKRSYPVGALGYRKTDINALLKRMM